jgi:transcriptional antiterminator RfaH
MKSWYAVQCKPLQDTRAEIHLRNQSYEVFRPQVRLRRRFGVRFRHVVESMFPGYLFIRLDNVVENWAPIRSTRGVANLVRWGMNAPRVPEPVINELRRRADGNNFIKLAPTEFRHHERIRITEGPFAGLEGLFDGRKGEERVIVLLEIMQRAQRLIVPERVIEHA